MDDGAAVRALHTPGASGQRAQPASPCQAQKVCYLKLQFLIKKGYLQATCRQWANVVSQVYLPGHHREWASAITQVYLAGHQ